MKGKKAAILGMLWLCLLLWGAGEDTPVKAAEQAGQPEDGYVGGLLEDLELEEMQQLLDGLLKENSFSLTEALSQLLEGKQPFQKETFLRIVEQAIYAEMEQQKGLLQQIFLLSVAAAFFFHLSKIFESGQLGEISFYVVYLLLFVLLVTAFGYLSKGMEENLSTIVELMRGLAPAYFLAVTAASGVVSAAAFYQIVLLLIVGVEWLILNFVLPGINLYVLLELVNHLSKEEMLSRLAQLLKTVIEWALRSLMGVIIGMQVIESLVTPVIDSLRRTTLGKTAGAIPGIGNAMNAVTEIILSSAVLVRNCLGVVFLLVFLLFGLSPIVRYALTGFLYKLMAAMLQPVSDKRIVGCLNTVGEGSILLLKALFTVEILSMVTIVILGGTFR